MTKDCRMTLIKTNSVMENLQEPKYPGLKFFQDKVGGYIAPIKFEINSGDERTMLVDEDGLAKELEPNEIASFFAKKLVVGDALVLNNFELE